MILQPLQSDTPYKVTVVAVYEDGDGGQLTGNGRTGNLAAFSFNIYLVLSSGAPVSVGVTGACGARHVSRNLVLSS